MMGSVGRARSTAAAAAFLTAGLAVGCRSASKRPPATTLNRLVARQAAAYVSRVLPARFDATRVSPVEARATLTRVKELASEPASAYACSPTSSVRSSSRVYRCRIGDAASVTASATCDVSTGLCRNWHVAAAVSVSEGTTFWVASGYIGP